MQDNKKINYKMIIAGKERVIPEVNLSQSRVNPEKLILSNSELSKISSLVVMDILTNDSLLSLEELEFLRNHFELTKSDIPYNQNINCAISDKENAILKKFFLSKKSK